MMPERVPPQNIDAEQAVLGALFLEPEAIYRVLDIIRPEDFYQHGHRLVYEAAVALQDEGEPIDLITVTDQLRRDGVLEKIGGAAYVASLVELVPTASNVEYYARLIEEKALLRTLIVVASRISELGYDEREAAERLVDQAEQMILELGSRRGMASFMPLKDILAAVLEKIEQTYQNKGQISGVPTGLADLDRICSGLQASDLVILAARPSMGKTALALNIAHHVAAKQNLPVAVFSLEMGREQLVNRLLCAEARVDQYRLRTGNLRDEDWERLTEAASGLQDVPLFIDDMGGASLRDIRARAKRMQAERGLALVVIDYVQLMQPNRRAENRQQEISQISRGLKELAKDLEVPVLALSQLSRAVEQRQDKRPQMSDLRESGCLTRDTLVQLADGQRKAIGQLAEQGTPVVVMALNETTWKLEPTEARKAWRVGVEPVFRLRTQLGREIRATANHKFRTLSGWKRLDQLGLGEHISAQSSGFEVPGCLNSEILLPVARNSKLATQNSLRLASSDVYWDKVADIESGGVEEVYDLEVPGHHNFMANDIVVHNSLEQDADVVMFIYRDEYYRPDTDRKGIAEIIVAKQRNGPTGKVELGFFKESPRFVNLMREPD